MVAVRPGGLKRQIVAVNAAFQFQFVQAPGEFVTAHLQLEREISDVAQIAGIGFPVARNVSGDSSSAAGKGPDQADSRHKYAQAKFHGNLLAESDDESTEKFRPKIPATVESGNAPRPACFAGHYLFDRCRRSGRGSATGARAPRHGGLARTSR